LICLLPQCQKRASSNNKLYIYNWTYYIPDDVLEGFEKEFNVTIVYDMYASNEEMFTKLKAGGTGYDIVFPSSDYISIMIHENMLAQIDKTKIPNFKNIDSAIIAKINFDKGNNYSIPYMMGCGGIAVNKNFVKEYKHSWSIFNRSDLNGRMTMLDDMREVLGAALKSLGYSVNTTDILELQEAKQVVLEWKKNIQKFDAESFSKAFAAGEFYVVHGYAENIFLEYDTARRNEIDYFIPEEGASMYIDNMVILKDAGNKEIAHKFINYIHRPEVYAKIADYLILPSLNKAARSFTKIKPNYRIEDLSNCEIRGDLGKYLEMYNKVWQEIRVGN